MIVLKQSVRVVYGFLLCLFCLISPVSGYDDGVTTLTISIDFAFGNDTNIVEYEEEIGDWFYTVIPKIVVAIPREQSDFSLAYSLRFDDYITESSFKNLSQNIDFLGRVDVSDRLTFIVSDKFVDSLYGIWRDETDSISGSEYFINTLSPELKYVSYSGSFAANISYAYVQEKWDVDATKDWQLDLFSANIAFKPFLNTSFGVFGRYSRKDFKGIPNDYTGSYAGASLGFTIPKIIDVTLRVGNESREYEELNESFSQIRYGFSLDKVFTEITSVQFAVFHHYNDSEVFLGDYYTSTGLGLDYSKEVLNDRIQLFLKGQYQINDYHHFSEHELLENTDEDREDKLSRIYVGAGIKFFEWLALQFFYGYSHRESNMPQYNIDDARYELHLKFDRKLHFEF